jgi:hypothetical protein
LQDFRTDIPREPHLEPVLAGIIAAIFLVANVSGRVAEALINLELSLHAPPTVASEVGLSSTPQPIVTAIVTVAPQ